MAKVAAHRTLHSATTRHEAWMFFHDDFPDRAARLPTKRAQTVLVILGAACSSSDRFGGDFSAGQGLTFSSWAPTGPEQHQ